MSEIDRDTIRDAILARLTERSDHSYQWPRWAAAEEAADVVDDLIRQARYDALTEAAEAIDREANSGPRRDYGRPCVPVLGRAAAIVRSLRDRVTTR